MSNYNEYSEELEWLFDKKKIGKKENILTNQNYKFYQKENTQNTTVIPFAYKNNNNCYKSQEFIIGKKKEIKTFDKNTNIRKTKKANKPMKCNITAGKKAYYEKNGKAEKFVLYIDKALGLNVYENIIKTRTYNPEEDYDSDDNIILDGKKKVDEDLFEAIEITKKNKFKNVCNYQRYHIKKNI